MKSTILIIMILTTLIFVSCKDSLQPEIYTDLSENNFFKTEADIKSALTPLYGLLGTDWGATDPGTGLYLMNFNVALWGYDNITRLMTDQVSDTWWLPYSQYTFGPATDEKDIRMQHYGKLRFVARATDVIDKISKAPLNDNLKAKYIAEAKVLRALIMSILYDLYGPLNPKLDPEKLTENIVEPRMSDADYIAAIDKDITEAMPNLPNKLNTDAANWGRVSKGCARMILFKLYLNKKNWNKAEAIGNELLSMGYELQTSYKNVFLIAANNEVIFSTPGNKGIASYWYKMIIPWDAKSVLGVGVQPGWLGEGMPWSFYDKYSADDERLQTIAKEYVTIGGIVNSRENGKLANAIPMKYLNFQPNDEGVEYVMYRYADVLLAMAEIENEKNGPTQKAINFVKQVTDRSKTAIPTSTTASKDAFRDFILDERGRELYDEFGIRRQDLIRHGKLISNARTRGVNAGEHQVLLAIPSHVIIESNGIIKQNPGYN